jgi:hypothetical protein
MQRVEEPLVRKYCANALYTLNLQLNFSMKEGTCSCMAPNETQKYGHESHGTQNQEWLCWQGAAAICQT